MPGRPDSPANRALAWLYCPPTQRRLLAALCALEAQIGASLASGLDHQVAHTRLAWWREECARCVQGRASHPITRELAVLLAPVDAHSLEGLSGLVDTAAWDLAAATFDTRRELSGYCERWSAAMIEPLARLAEPTLEPGQARAIGASLREIELLLALAGEARRGRLRLPLDELARARAAPEELARPPWQANLAALIADRHRALRAALTAGVAALTPMAQAALRGVIVWAAIDCAHSRRAQALLPRANLAGVPHALADGWRAWRAARRAGRGMGLA
jgi:phytoene/squalene synthetase